MSIIPAEVTFSTPTDVIVCFRFRLRGKFNHIVKGWTLLASTV